MGNEHVFTPEKAEPTVKVAPSPMKSQNQESARGVEQGAVTMYTSFSGPIPPPQFLEKYEQMVPGIAKKFLEQPHLEAEHRRELDKMLVQEQIKLSKRGQYMAFCLAGGCVVGAFVAIYYGQSLEGLGALLISAAAFAGIFIYAKKQ